MNDAQYDPSAATLSPEMRALVEALRELARTSRPSSAQRVALIDACNALLAEREPESDGLLVWVARDDDGTGMVWLYAERPRWNAIRRIGVSAPNSQSSLLPAELAQQLALAPGECVAMRLVRETPHD